MKSYQKILLICLLALALRLTHALGQNHLIVYNNTGGDSWWYLEYGYLLMSGFDYSEVSIPTAPLYLVVVGFWQQVLSPEGAIIAVRVLQALMGTATCYFAYGLARAVSRHEGAGLIAAGALAISPVFVIETAQIATETLYIFLVTGGLWLYVAALNSHMNTPVPRSTSAPTTPVWFYRSLVGVGLLLGLATLTRAVPLLFPLGLGFHLLLIFRRRWRYGLKYSLVLLVVYVLTVSTWTIYNLVKWDRFVIGAPGFAAFLYLGASDTGWQGPTEVDAGLAAAAGLDVVPDDPEAQQELYQQAAAQIITRDPLGWFGRRLGQLTGALLQPHGTTFFRGESLKDLAANWFTQDRSLSGLLRLTAGDSFWPKLVVYIFHYVAVVGGLVGLWLTRHNWRVTLPLAGFILYTVLVHLLLDAIPRYLFPAEVIAWVFAAAALARVPLFRRAAAPAQSAMQSTS